MNLIPEINENNKFTVVFDLDETLIYNRGKFVLRDYAVELLEKIKLINGIEIILWTASVKETCLEALHKISEKELFDHIIWRSNVWYDGEIHVKDLRLLGRDMNKIIIVENAPLVCIKNPENAILVQDFMGDDETNYDYTLYCVYKALNYCIHLSVNLDMSIQSAIKTLPCIEIFITYNSNNYECVKCVCLATVYEKYIIDDNLIKEIKFTQIKKYFWKRSDVIYEKLI